MRIQVSTLNNQPNSQLSFTPSMIDSLNDLQTLTSNTTLDLSDSSNDSLFETEPVHIDDAVHTEFFLGLYSCTEAQFKALFPFFTQRTILVIPRKQPPNAGGTEDTQITPIRDLQERIRQIELMHLSKVCIDPLATIAQRVQELETAILYNNLTLLKEVWSVQSTDYFYAPATTADIPLPLTIDFQRYELQVQSATEFSTTGP